MKWAVVFLSVLLVACGANGTDVGEPRVEPNTTAEPEPEPTPGAEAEPEPEPEPEPVVEAEPEPEPVEIEAGTRLGPIRIGMAEEEVRALGLEASPVDPRTTAFGPYHVVFRDGQVRRVEGQMGALGRIRFDGQVLTAGTHISELRDAFGDCVWTEGGGERYECSGATLFVHTTHSMDPLRYTVGVEAR